MWGPRNLWDNPVEQEGQGRAMEGRVCAFSWGDKDTQSTYGTPTPTPTIICQQLATHRSNSNSRTGKVTKQVRTAAV